MRRKKWSEEEEETLIMKYGEMSGAGTLVRLKTREKKFEPIAAHVNALHHAVDSVSFPWEWTWRDLSVKIQNMRHQYLGVKQKIRRPPYTKQPGEQEEYDWTEGIVHWSNFLRYKEIFGDVELESNELGTGGSGSSQNRILAATEGRVRCSTISSKVRRSGNSDLPGERGVSINIEREAPRVLAEIGEAGASGLRPECDGEEEYGRKVDAMIGSKTKKLKRKRDRLTVGDGGVPILREGKLLAILGAYFTEQREREAQKEAREKEKEREREGRELLREAAKREREQSRQERERIREEQERRRDRERGEREWERDVMNRERWEEERQRERNWEEKLEREKQDWREKMATLQMGHQSTLARMQTQVMQCQQNVVSLILGVFLHRGPVEETPGQRSSLASQILRNLQQQYAGDGIVQAGDRKGGAEDTDYVVDGEVSVLASELGSEQHSGG